jgi:hypothetical protein
MGMRMVRGGKLIAKNDITVELVAFGGRVFVFLYTPNSIPLHG